MCLVSELIATPLGALIMTKTTLNTAMISSTALEFSGIFILLVTPETLHCNRATGHGSVEDSRPSLIQDQEASEGLEVAAIQVKANQPASGRFTRVQLHHFLQSVVRPLRFVSKDRLILLSLPAFLTSRLLRQVVSILLQWASKKLAWSIAAVSAFLFWSYCAYLDNMNTINTLWSYTIPT